MEVFLGWVLFSILAGGIATQKGRSGAGFFFLSLMLSPMIGVPAALLVGSKESNPNRSTRRSDSTGGIVIEVSVGGGSNYGYYTDSPRIQGRASTSADCWVPLGTEATVGSFSIKSGMIYVGKNLPQASDSGHLELALIDPSLKLGRSPRANDGGSMSYWPSYSSISADDRAGYLGWLAGSRADPDVYIGYVFLFFYGLERRALFDAKESNDAWRDLPAIREEVERLLSLYGKNHSFQSYACGFLDYLTVVDVLHRDAYPDLPTIQPIRGLPWSLKMAVGKMAVEEKRLPATWALAWVRLDVEIGLRTPARRCEEEFDGLFLLRYSRKHKDGIKLTNCKRRLRLDYRPASGSFSRTFDRDLDLPDVTRLVGPRRKLQDIAIECTDSLDSYSRLLGRSPDQAGTIAAAALLPEDLVEHYAPPALGELRDRLNEALTSSPTLTLPVEDVAETWLPRDGSKLTKKAAVESAKLLSHIGIGIVPDVRFSGMRIARGNKVVLFQLPKGSGDAPTTAYRAALALIHLATMVSAADGSISVDEETHIKDYIAARLRLDQAETVRLTASLEWMLMNPPSGAGLKKRLAALPQEERTAVAQFLVSVAWADGRIDPDEVKMLSKLYAMLGLDSAAVHDDIQSMHGAASAETGPVTIMPATAASSHRIPPEQKKAVPKEITLDASRIEYIEGETAKLVRALSTVFEDDEEVATSDPIPPHSSIGGLDSAHSALVVRLGAQMSWDREAYETLAEELGLFPGSALEVINDVAFDLCDEPLLEGEDTLHLNSSVLKEVTQ
jgi:uncharacterized tellurite resistance protein B-like protein